MRSIRETITIAMKLIVKKDHSRWEWTKADLSFVNMLQDKIKTDVPNVDDYTEFKTSTEELCNNLDSRFYKTT